MAHAASAAVARAWPAAMSCACAGAKPPSTTRVLNAMCRIFMALSPECIMKIG